MSACISKEIPGINEELNSVSQQLYLWVNLEVAALQLQDASRKFR